MSSSAAQLRVLTCQSNGILGDGVKDNIARWRQKLLSMRPLADLETGETKSNLTLDVIQFPETAFQRYFYCDKADLVSHGEQEECGKGPVFAFLKELAFTFEAYIIAGYVEKDSEEKVYYNSLYVVNRDGSLLLNHRKRDLFQPDFTWTAPFARTAAGENDPPQDKYTTFPLTTRGGQELLAGLILCQELLGFSLGVSQPSPGCIVRPAVQFASQNVQVIFLSACWPTNEVPGSRLREFGKIWEKQTEEMNVVDSGVASEHPVHDESGSQSTVRDLDWLFCVANGCGSEENCLTKDSWGSLADKMDPAERPTLQKKGCSGVKKYSRMKRGSAYESEGVFADVVLQSEDGDTVPVLPPEDEAWKLYEVEMRV